MVLRWKVLPGGISVLLFRLRVPTIIIVAPSLRRTFYVTPGMPIGSGWFNFVAFLPLTVLIPLHLTTVVFVPTVAIILHRTIVSIAAMAIKFLFLITFSIVP